MSVFRGQHHRLGRRLGVAGGLLGLLITNVLGWQQLAGAADPIWTVPKPADVAGVRVLNAPTQPARSYHAQSRVDSGPDVVTWPQGTAVAELAVATTGLAMTESRPTAGTQPAAGAAGALPVTVTAADPVADRVGVGPDLAVGTAVGKVRVTVYDRSATARAAVEGLLLSTQRADGDDSAGQVDVRLDYRGFADAFGGDWSSRLRVVRLPACALTTPEVAACRTQTAVVSKNDAVAGTLTARTSVSGAATVLAATAGDSGDNGDYTATSLAPAGQWQVANQTGDFSWSYALRSPPALGGPSPTVTLAYSSGSIDGRTALTNNQGSWIGDGWDSWPGFIERKYQSCGDDNPSHKTGDQCWFNDNASLSLNGHSGELIKNGSVWHLRDDDGTRVEKLTDPARGNGDNDNEYWKVTTPDGMQYYFGYHRLPGWTTGQETTDSTWTVPVFGNDTGEPCYDASFASAYCSQAWRWNLDYVVDPRANTMAYFYGKETGAYARDNTASQRTTYDRGGYLKRIDYGMRAGAEYAQAAPLRMTFTTAERCLSGCWTGAAWTSEPVASAWDDTPWDRYCKATPCTQGSPTFWTARRLTTVTAQVRSGATSYRNVESWALRQEFINAGTGESTPMWLRGITRTGLVTTAGGSVVSDPEITFDTGAEPMPNRVDGPNDQRTELNRWRIKAIHTESGGDIIVTYSAPDCTRTTLPQPATNTKRCMPSFYALPGQDSTLDWFNKYVVTRVDLDDRVTDAPTETTFYDYLDSPAWAYNTDEMTKDKYRTWADWRGYGRVQVRHGDATGQQTAIEYRYLRGMDGDKATSGTKDVRVSDTWGGSTEDHLALRGFELQKITLDGPGGSEVDSTLNTPWRSGPTATRTRNAITTEAWRLETGTVQTRTALASGGFRTSKTTTTFNSDSLPTTVDDFGDVNVSGDETCTRTTYARNDATWMIDKVAQTELLAGTCAAAASPAAPATVLHRTRSFYDTYVNDASFATAPTNGNVVRTEELDSFSGSTPVYTRTATTVYDANGRVTDATDARGYTTHTTYNTANGGLVTANVDTDALGHQTTTSKEPAWDEPTRVLDANGVATDLSYNGLGRLTAVWLPGRAKATQSPSKRYTYQIHASGGPTAVTTETLLPTGSTYLTSINLYDGFLRLRQNQAQATGGGRLITETFYNSAGHVSGESEAYYDTSNAAPSTSLALPQGQIPAINRTLFDGVGRESAQVLIANGVEKWRTTTTYGGDRTTTTPPTGGVASTTITDVKGQTVKLRQYDSYADVGTQDPTRFVETRYSYTLDKQLATVTDQAGNLWTHKYDLRGREFQTTDPDRGPTTTSYDAAGNAIAVTAPLGTGTATTATTYDALGRKTTVRDDSATGTIRSQWVYDTLPGGKGKLTSATRFVNGNAYISRTDSLDEFGRPTSTSVALPTTESALCVAPAPNSCTFTSLTSYKPNGDVYQVTVPAAADLASEKLTFGYTDVGRPGTLLSASQIYVNTVNYSKIGEMTQLTLGAFGSRVALTSTIDEPTRRLTGLNVVPELKPEAANYSYSYDAVGNVTKIADAPATQAADTQCYSFDELRRMTNAWTQTAAACGAVPTAWSQVGGPAPYWQAFTYDSTGNRTTEVSHGSTNTTYLYGYPAAGTARPHAVSTVTATGGASFSHTYGYDSAGNTTTRTTPSGSGQTLTYDREGHLSTLVAGSATSRYLYDVDGNVLVRTDATGKTAYLPNGLEVRAEGAVKKATRYYSHDNDTIAERTGSGLSWIVSDYHGTAELTIDATTLAVAKRRTLPFGDARGTVSGTWTNGMDKGFVGGTVDPSGLVHLGAREYDPFLGRFTSPDPMVDTNDPQTMEGYAYGNNAPSVNADASGLCWLVCDALKSTVSAAKSTFNSAVDSVKDDVSAGLSAMGDAVDTVGSATWDGLKATGKWVKDNRGLLVTIGATLGCMVPAVGLLACAGLQAVAYGVRTQQTIADKGGWDKNKKEIIGDGLFTAGTLGLEGAFRMAQFNTLRGIKGAPIIGLPKWLSASNALKMEEFQTEGWNILGDFADPFVWISWTIPDLASHIIGEPDEGGEGESKVEPTPPKSHPGTTPPKPKHPPTHRLGPAIYDF